MIRHVSDYGCIILMDERFRTGGIEISKWLNECRKTYTELEPLENDLCSFYKSNAPDWKPQA